MEWTGVQRQHEKRDHLALPVLQLSTQSASDGRLRQQVAGQCRWPLQSSQSQQTFSRLFCLVQEANDFSSAIAKKMLNRSSKLAKTKKYAVMASSLDKNNVTKALNSIYIQHALYIRHVIFEDRNCN